MIVMSIRTDKPGAELGIYDDQKQLAYDEWEAHRRLAETINKKIEEILNLLSISLKDVQGVVVYEGPGSFTGLRIGFSVANALAYGLKIPIVAAGGSEWINKGIKNLLAGQSDKIALPKYGAPPHITEPRK